VPALTPKEIFARNVKRLRTAAGLSQEELAARAGLHRTYISSIERAQRNISLENIFLLANALGAGPGDLLNPVSQTEED
jgi:transcriptional regulator with XRE-family HTH domain